MKIPKTWLVSAAVFALVAMLGARARGAEVNWGGYGNLHWMDMEGMPLFLDAPVGGSAEPDLNNPTIQLREFTIFLESPLSERLVASAEIEAGDNGDTFSLNYGYVEILAADWLEFKAGKILVPFLAYNERKANHYQSLMSQPFTAWQFAPVTGNPWEAHGLGWSDVGFQVAFKSSIAAGNLELKLAVINGLGSDDPNVLDANFLYFEDGMPGEVRPRDGLAQNESANVHTDNNGTPAGVAKLTYLNTASSVRAEFGLSFYYGNWDTADDHTLAMYGAHFRLEGRKWELAGEVGSARVEQEAGLFADGDTLMIMSNQTTGNYHMNSWYIEAAARVLEYGEDNWVKLIARYDDVDTNDEAMFTPFDRSRITAGLEWQFDQSARLRYEFQRSTIDDYENAMPMVQDSVPENPSMHMLSVIFWF